MHTPGPYAIEEPMGPRELWIVEADKQAHEWEPLATVPIAGKGRISVKERHANAKLFTAAPDLLAALIGMVQTNQDDLTIEHYNRARAAIAKAERGA